MAVEDGDVLKVSVSINAPDGVEMYNIFHYKLHDPTPENPTAAQIITALDAQISVIYNIWDDEMSTNYTIDTMTVDKVEWDAVDSIWEVVENVGSSLLDIAGLGISDATPHGVAANITLNTADPKRRGRKFFPGASEDGVTNSTWIGAVATVLANMAVEILEDKTLLTNAVLEPGIASNLGTWLPLIIAAVNTFSAYQRRRKPGVGS